MNYYFDLDNTLYETANLTKDMLRTISTNIVEKQDISYEIVEKDVNDNFNSTNDNILEYARKVAINYEVDEDFVIGAVKNVIANGEKYVFKDAIPFLEKLRETTANKLFLLTYVSKGNQDYQQLKILGSKLAKYFDGIFIVTEHKFELDLDYTNGIFFDDSPRDLNGLYEKHPQRLIRIRKPNNKRSAIDIDIDIEEYDDFSKISI